METHKWKIPSRGFFICVTSRQESNGEGVGEPGGSPRRRVLRTERFSERERIATDVRFLPRAQHSETRPRGVNATLFRVSQIDPKICGSNRIPADQCDFTESISLIFFQTAGSTSSIRRGNLLSNLVYAIYAITSSSANWVRMRHHDLTKHAWFARGEWPAGIVLRQIQNGVLYGQVGATVSPLA